MTASTAFSALHALAVIVWVGGMFFAHVVLRPSVSALEPPQRLALMDRVLGRFFVWVWVAVVVLPATGYGLVFLALGGFAAAGMHVHLMQAIGWIMIIVFVFLHAVPYRRFHGAVTAEDWATAGSAPRPHPAPRRDQPGARPDHRRDRRLGPVLELSAHALRRLCISTSACPVRCTGHLSAARPPDTSCLQRRDWTNGCRWPTNGGAQETRLPREVP